MDNTYDTPEFNYEELEFLRQNTRLGPISMAKIQQIKSQIEKYRRWFLKNEGELLESDYTPADLLEYELRLKAWERFWEKEWKKNPDGLGLSEFSRMILEQKMNTKQR